MYIKSFKNKFEAELSDLYAQSEVNHLFNLLLEHITEYTRVDLMVHADLSLTKHQKEQFEDGLYRLRNYEPVQYIIGATEFYGIHLNVNKHVLIPRPETEELVDWILADAISNKNLRVLDIGTGSGCIPIALAKNLPKAEVSAVDISDEALKLAEENARQNKVKVKFFKSDVLQVPRYSKKYDVLVSNPPYIREVEKTKMKRNVLDYEPEVALFVADDDALIFYRKIIEFAKYHLQSGGHLYFELNEFLKDKLNNLFEEAEAFRYTFKKDGFGKYRMARLIKK